MTKFVEPLEIVVKFFQGMRVIRVITEEPWSRRRIISATRHNTSSLNNASDS
jgi:hypothetical protein